MLILYCSSMIKIGNISIAYAKVVEVLVEVVVVQIAIVVTVTKVN